MRKLTVLLTMLVCVASGGVKLAQQGDKAAKPFEALRSYLEGDESLRDLLVTLDPKELKGALAALEFPEVESGVQRHVIECPDGFERPYFLALPREYDASRAYPLLIVMHGGVLGNRAQAARGFAERVVGELPKGWEAKLMVMGVAANVPKTTRDAAWWNASGQNNVLVALRDAKARYNVDDDRVLLAGMSDGGCGVYAFAAQNQDHFAGFYSWVGNPGIAQQFDSHIWFENLRTCPLRHVLGVRDHLHSAERIRSLVDAMQKNGAQIELQEYQQAGHDLSYLSQELEIMLEKRELPKRDFFPEAIDWSTDRVEAGRHAWISIDSIGEIGGYDAQESGWFPAYPGILAMSPIQLGVTLKQGSKIIVDQVNAGSLAEELGLESGDELKELDGLKLHSLDDLRDAIMEGIRGEAFTGVLIRDGETLEFEGTWPLFEPNPGFARVHARHDSKGRVDVRVHNVRQLSIWVAPEMLDADGEMVVVVNGEEVYRGVPEADSELIFSEFERTHDRKRPFTSRLSFDLEALLGSGGGEKKGPSDKAPHRESPQVEPGREEDF